MQNFSDGDRATFRVKSDTGSSTYKVIITDYLDEDSISFSCSCPDEFLCKHDVAAALKLDEILGAPAGRLSNDDTAHISNEQANGQDAEQKATLVFTHAEPGKLLNMANPVETPLIPLDSEKYLKNLSSKEELAAGKKTFKQTYIREVAFYKEAIIHDVPVQTYSWYSSAHAIRVVFSIDGDKLTSTCACGRQLPYPLCEHKIAVLLRLISLGRSWYGAISAKTQIESLLIPYGLTYDSPERARYFDVAFSDGKIALRPRDAGLMPLPQKSTELLSVPKFTAGYRNDPTPSTSERKTLHWALIPAEAYLPAKIVPLIAVLNAKTGNLSHVSNALEQTPDKYVHLMTGVDLKLAKTAPQALNIVREVGPPREMLLRRAAANSIESFRYMQQLPSFFQAEQATTGTVRKPREISVGELVEVSMNLTETEDCFILQARFKRGEQWKTFDAAEWYGHTIFMYENAVYSLPDPETTARLDFFAQHGFSIRVLKSAGFDEFYNAYASPLSPYFHIDINVSSINYDRRLLEPADALLYLEDDTNQKLHFTPVFRYRFGDTEAEFTRGGSGGYAYAEGDTVVEHYRNSEWESEKMQDMETLHPAFAEQSGADSYLLSFDQAMQDSWISSLAESARNAGVILLGEKTFKNFKYSTATPKYDLRISSGIDWFDVKPTLTFGDEKVSLKKLRQAVLEGRHYVVLSDGTYGMLPTEWLRKLAPVFRLGSEDKNGMRMRTAHAHMLSELAEEAGDHELAEEISVKYNRLLTADTIKASPLPNTLTATMRAYQYKGYSWLRYHEMLGFGALLADDMGLGKTLQVLAQLTAVCEEDPSARHLVVMPTGLLYNWRNEAVKFSPGLRVATYHGPQRGNMHEWKTANLVLTTYGTLRSDIELFSKEKWDYVVLDESQAVKNPGTAAAQSVKRLKARNRIAMTGTPVENRTMDLFSQLDFLNPGLLGSTESFFRNYARPIDRDGDEQMAHELRKLVAPYILRRTKQQVATDLPAKTETTLYCALTPAQARQYDQVKEEYREKIMEKISEDGRNAAGTLILAGLTKLRQVCDSAAIIRPELASTPGHSSKLDLLEEELASVTENNKVLVFSNFLGMLALIRERMEKRGIGFSYMDGSTRDREGVVEEFKSDETKRVFLITMKTGGVGLNLTQAGYVYITDPWWNPAAEQQAIDRTHRIGQTNPVFAYKMITTGTVEEKILELQKRKQKLAGDLISTDEGILSQLSDTEVLDLFN
ncbi:MAG: DEAD/DEAH box helicase [Bacteroidota bacterium]